MASLQLFSPVPAASPFIPHGHCYLWQPQLVWLHLLSDGIIALAYYLIALVLVYLVQRRQDVPFRSLFWLFGVFIAACGTTHLFAIWTLWFPTYWVSGGIKAFTALVSLYTALELIPRLPQALAMATPRQLELVNLALLQEIGCRKAAEATAQQLNRDLEQRVETRTAELARTQAEKEALLHQEQQARADLEVAVTQFQHTTERLNLALSAAHMGTWDWDLEHQTQIWSPQMERILGLPAQTPHTYEQWAARVHPDDLPRVRAVITQSRQNQDTFSVQYRVFWPDTSLHWVMVHGRTVENDNGQTRRMVGVIQDISEQKQAELSIQASEARFRAVFEQAAVAMARLDPEGRWLQVNQRFCDLLDYRAEELIGQSFQAITDPQDQAQSDQAHRQLAQGEIESCQFEKRYLHRDGTPIWTLVTVSAELTPSEQITGFIAVIEDMRQWRQAQQELQQRADELEGVNRVLAHTTALLDKRNTELDQFAYVASHDLKAPLRAIANLSEWIEEDLNGQLPPENQHQFALLRSRVLRMEALINGLLAYSRVGRQAQLLEPVDVNELIQDVIDSLDPPAAFTITVAPDLPTVHTSPVALSQVFANLIGNAIKHHHRPQGQIDIAMRDLGSRVEFMVADDGPGIAPQYHGKIFVIFQTLKARDQLESTGIGLSVVKKVVEAEGGTIRLESSLGEGSHFYFTWPK